MNVEKNTNFAIPSAQNEPEGLVKVAHHDVTNMFCSGDRYAERGEKDQKCPMKVHHAPLRSYMTCLTGI